MFRSKKKMNEKNSWIYWALRFGDETITRSEPFSWSSLKYTFMMTMSPVLSVWQPASALLVEFYYENKFLDNLINDMKFLANGNTYICNFAANWCGSHVIIAYIVIDVSLIVHLDLVLIFIAYESERMT